MSGRANRARAAARAALSRHAGARVTSPDASILVWAFAAVALSALAPQPVGAHFERMLAGARGTAIGRAYSAIADDGSAVSWNTAALVTMRRSEILFVHSRPYVVENLGTQFASAVHHRDRTSVSVAWHHTGVENVVSEDMVTFGVARDVVAYTGSYALAIGANVKLASVSYDADAGEIDYGSQRKLTADLSALVNLSPTVAVGYVVRNVIEPTFDFVDGGGRTRLERIHDVSLSYRWHPESVFALSLNQDARGDWLFNTGAEVSFYDVFALRAGVSGGDFAGGVGLAAERFLVDVAFVTNDDLGISYELSLRVPFGEPRW